MGTPPRSDFWARSNRAADLGRSATNFFVSDSIKERRWSRWTTPDRRFVDWPLLFIGDAALLDAARCVNDSVSQFSWPSPQELYMAKPLARTRPGISSVTNHVRQTTR